MPNIEIPRNSFSPSYRWYSSLKYRFGKSVHQPTAAFSRRRKDVPNSSRSCRPMSNSELHAQDNILQKLQKQSLYNPIPPEQAKGGGILPSFSLYNFAGSSFPSLI
ncbi:hypothetical protein CEXT_591171 [Caerostris extrusa]|uniref:Uncharacterized protein n=1 Tax=Caerostris extrusa TaxID=172846 RepID=A0AAV4YCF3_CAEEX|nr:hypothetical protein CEXT_591171 [Caerostris extrusa]